jgi:hypothetical protein
MFLTINNFCLFFVALYGEILFFFGFVFVVRVSLVCLRLRKDCVLPVVG